MFLGIFFLLFVLLIPLLLLLAFFGMVSISFVRLGIPRSLVAFLFIAILVGSLINIPLVAVHGDTPVRFFHSTHIFYLQPPQTNTTIIALNVGGALVPLLLCLYLLPRAPLLRTAIAIAIVAGVAYWLSSVVPNQGVELNVFIPPIVSAVVAMVIAWRSAAPVAYIAGVVGTLVGADLLHLGAILGEQAGSSLLSIGGAGVFDGIFLVGIIAAFLSPGSRRKARA